MQRAIGYTDFGHPRSLIEERPQRPPIIGKIRPGIKVLTKRAKESEQAVKIHDALLAQGASFEAIGEEIERKTKIRNALVPKNTAWFTCRGSDFTNPATADEILQKYGEDRGDGLKLWRFPVIFAFDDWLANMPNQLKVWGTRGLQYFSEYGADGKRHCKMYAAPEVDERAQRAKRLFGGRTVILRQDGAIPDGVCDPHQCPQYQGRHCNLSASLYFCVPEIKGLGLIELPTTSIYVLQKAYAAMQTVAMARGGRLAGMHFWLSKKAVDITRIGEDGLPIRQEQMLTMLDAEIDLGALLDSADQIAPALDAASKSVALLEGAMPAGDGPSMAPLVDISGAMPLEPERAPTPVSTPVASPMPAPMPTAADPEDRESILADLAARLGMSVGQERMDLLTFARMEYGQGWTKRPKDVDSMIGEMQTALANPLAFREQVRSRVLEATQPV
ncbi:recombination directionality factor [Cupriavidus basilensis]